MNKFGKFILCLVPTIGFLAVQIVVTMVVEVVWMLRKLDMSLMAADPSGAMNNVISSMTADGNFIMSVTIISQIAGFIIAVIIYMTVFKQKKLEAPGKVFGPASIVSIIILMISLELTFSCLMIKAYDWIPGIMEGYSEMIESSGLADMTVLSTIATLIMAPLGEELVFRGMTLNLAGRLTKKF
ncbi:MAG: hypothetical protein MJ092_08675, partial [Lachnospiraceae bacterium]|nr:hypothetical protein [Lachnospiraceae bacterium]